MAGYIGAKQGVTQVDGYNRSEADAEFVNDPNDVITVSGSNVGIGTSSPENANKLDVVADGADRRIAMRTQNTLGSASVEAQVNNYWSGATYTGTALVQYDSAATGTTAGLSNANLGALRFQNGSNGLIYTNGSQSLVFGTVSTERMRIDSAGRVTMPSQPHIFGSVTNTTGTGTANSFVTRFSQGGLTFVTDRITVPVAGLYAISFNSLCTTSTGRIDSTVRINGAVVLSQLSEDNGSGFHYRSASAVLKLQASDYIQFTNNSWYNATGTVFDEWRTASVTLIG